MTYSASYFDNYYDGTYEDTFHYGFPLDRILNKEWASQYKEPPRSFADIGCGCGQTLVKARELLPTAEVIYGIEKQNIPAERIASKDLIIGDFMEIYPQLPQVDLLYVSCSMYIPWPQQHEFLLATTAMARKAIVFANLYLEDGKAIPYDQLRQVIYKSRISFNRGMETLGFKSIGSRAVDVYIPNSTSLII
jgi:SAM-dependent methyltransferase